MSEMPVRPHSELEKSKSDRLSMWALLLSLIPVISLLGLILAIRALLRRAGGKGYAIAAIVIFVVQCVATPIAVMEFVPKDILDKYIPSQWFAAESEEEAATSPQEEESIFEPTPPKPTPTPSPEPGSAASRPAPKPAPRPKVPPVTGAARIKLIKAGLAAYYKKYKRCPPSLGALVKSGMLPLEVLQHPTDPEGPIDYIFVPFNAKTLGRVIVLCERGSMTPDGRSVLYASGKITLLDEETFFDQLQIQYNHRILRALQQGPETIPIEK